MTTTTATATADARAREVKFYAAVGVCGDWKDKKVVVKQFKVGRKVHFEDYPVMQ